MNRPTPLAFFSIGAVVDFVFGLVKWHSVVAGIVALVIVARDDFSNADGLRLPHIRAWFDKAPQPKEMIVLDGSAHAQFLFQTDQADRLMKEVLRFLTETFRSALNGAIRR